MSTNVAGQPAQDELDVFGADTPEETSVPETDDLSALFDTEIDEPGSPAQQQPKAAMSVPAATSTKGVPLEVANRAGLKGSQMFGAPPAAPPNPAPAAAPAGPTKPATVASAPAVGPPKATKAAAVAVPATRHLPAPEGVAAGPAAQPAKANSVAAPPAKAAPVQAKLGQELEQPIENTDDAIAYLELTQMPWDKLSEAQRFTRNFSHELLRRQRESARALIRALADDDREVEMTFNIADDAGPIRVVVSPKDAPESTDGGSQTPAGRAASGPRPPGHDDVDKDFAYDTERGGFDKIAEKPHGISAAQLQQQCQRVVTFQGGATAQCTAKRMEHQRASGKCFKRDCPCRNTCGQFVEVAPETTAQPARAAAAPAKAAPTATAELTYPAEASGVAQSEPVQQPAASTEVAQEAAEAQEDDGVREIFGWLCYLNDFALIIGRHGGPPESTNYWPVNPQMDKQPQTVERRTTMMSRILAWFNKATRVVVENVPVERRPRRKDLKHDSESYRVVLGAISLAAALEQYAVGWATPGYDEKALTDAVTGAAGRYLEAYKPLPGDEAQAQFYDQTWDEYVSTCEAWNVEPGTYLHEITAQQQAGSPSPAQ